MGAPVFTGSSSTTVFFIKSSGGGIKPDPKIIGLFVMFCCYIASLNYSAMFVLLSLYSYKGLSISSSPGSSSSLSFEWSSITYSSCSDFRFSVFGSGFDLELSLAYEVALEFFFEVSYTEPEGTLRTMRADAVASTAVFSFKVDMFSSLG
jgi:hypothetical protein